MDMKFLKLPPFGDSSLVTRTTISIDRNLEDELMGSYMTVDQRANIEYKLSQAFELLECPK